jgi:hypothetical protein
LCTLQLNALIKYRCDERDIHKEKVSGSKRDREQLNAVLDLLRDGDKLVVWRLDRLARSQRDLLELSDLINSKGAELVSLILLILGLGDAVRSGENYSRLCLDSNTICSHALSELALIIKLQPES